MIPKVIHYCWFGKGEKSALIQACIASWHKHMPDWEFIEWNEENSPIDHPFVSKALNEKKYAFAADYVRCFALYNMGGIYLDTDMEIIKNLEPLISYDFFAGYEDDNFDKINCAIFGGIPKNIILKELLEYYDNNVNYYVAIPQILGRIYNSDICENSKIFTYEVFYPYHPFNESREIKQLMYRDITEETYGIHHWEFSWKMSKLSNILNLLKKKIYRFLDS